MSSKKTKIVYIAGYGRSGSTIVDIVLGNHPQACSLGEVGFLVDDVGVEGRTCSCQKTYEECEFWCELAKEIPELDRAAILNAEKSSKAFGLLFGLVSDSSLTCHHDYTVQLISHLKGKSDTQVFIDSSKSARAKRARPLLLHRADVADVYVLHVTRNGKSVTESLLTKGSNWAIEGHEKGYRTGILRSAIGWVAANVWPLLFKWKLPAGRYLRIKFEDFQQNPQCTVEKICRWCELDPEPMVQLLAEATSFKVGHMVGGNRVRYENQIRLQTPSTAKPGQKLSSSQRLVFGLLAGWLNKVLEY